MELRKEGRIFGFEFQASEKATSKTLGPRVSRGGLPVRYTPPFSISLPVELIFFFFALATTTLKANKLEKVRKQSAKHFIEVQQ